jgi:GNAT superfamily N-acetyltransferase
MQPDYCLRGATEADAGVIAEQRARMFFDMGLVSAEEARLLAEAARPWLLGLIERGEYVGWVMESGEAVVAGGGLHLRELGPVLGCLRVGRAAHLVNVYTAPAWRRLGLARRVMEAMLGWCAAEGIDQVTLSASEEGRGLYEALGFVKGAEMRLVLAAPDKH